MQERVAWTTARLLAMKAHQYLRLDPYQLLPPHHSLELFLRLRLEDQVWMLLVHHRLRRHQLGSPLRVTMGNTIHTITMPAARQPRPLVPRHHQSLELCLWLRRPSLLNLPLKKRKWKKVLRTTCRVPKLLAYLPLQVLQ